MNCIVDQQSPGSKLVDNDSPEEEQHLQEIEVAMNNADCLDQHLGHLQD
jgi:hypothetical protein